MSKKIVIPFTLAAVSVLIVGGVVAHAWSIRDTYEKNRAARKEAVKELRALKPAENVPFLRKLATEKTMHVWFEPSAEGDVSPWRFWSVRWGEKTRVSTDFVAQLTEERIIYFAGNDADRKSDAAMIKEMLAFSDELIKMNILSKDAVNSLNQRRLDGFFLTGDYDAAISFLENVGLAEKSKEWNKSTAAKVRAHKAMEAGDKKEAIKQLLVFVNYMLSDEQKDFEDVDPINGIVYSREWVAARTYVRCMKMSRELGDNDAAAKYLAEAKKYFAPAVEKAKEDAKSLEAVKAEMKENGI